VGACVLALRRSAGAGEPGPHPSGLPPGNVLWSGSRIVGVVDWATSSRGDPGADIGHCRANLTEFGLATPDVFLDLCRQAGVCTDYDPYWDLAAAVDVGHWADEPEPVLGPGSRPLSPP
jgi:hypothetical protein